MKNNWNVDKLLGICIILFLIFSTLLFWFSVLKGDWPAYDRGPAGFDAQGNPVEKPAYVVPKQRTKVKYWPKYKIVFYPGTSGIAGFSAPDAYRYYTDSYELLNGGVKFTDSDKVERFISGQYEIRPYDDYIYIWENSNAD